MGASSYMRSPTVSCYKNVSYYMTNIITLNSTLSQEENKESGWQVLSALPEDPDFYLFFERISPGCLELPVQIRLATNIQRSVYLCPVNAVKRGIYHRHLARNQFWFIAPILANSQLSITTVTGDLMTSSKLQGHCMNLV